jgi:phosphate uptake regulator
LSPYIYDNEAKYLYTSDIIYINDIKIMRIAKTKVKLLGENSLWGRQKCLPFFYNWFMKRKIIKQANQAYTITLPIDWVRKNQIDKNSEVDVAAEGKTLVINSENSVAGGKIGIDMNGIKGKNIGGVLNALYAKGIDEISFKSKEDISNDIVNYLAQNLGYALVEQKQDIYIIKDIKTGETKDLDEIFKRVFQIILLFYESAIKDIFGEEKETIEGLDKRDQEVNKFCLFLQRAINKSSYPDPIKGRALFTYSFCLEKIGDEIHRLWRTNIKYKIKKSKEIKELLELSLSGLENAFELYYQFNLSKPGEIFKIRENTREKAMELKKLDAITLRFARHAVKIAEDCGDLTPLTLMINLDKSNS